ncbi:electron transfer flavoprotein subunit alpha/FixB family protein [Chloroflexota bacterium]
MSEYKGVMIYAEVADSKLMAISTELLGCGRKLADDLGEELSAVLVGSGVADLAEEVIAFGADKVYIVNDPQLKDYQTDSYTTAMEKVVRHAMPQILLLGQTATGRDLTPRLAFKLDTAATMDCLELAIDVDSKLMLQTKPVYGGNAQAIYTCESYPQMATIRAKAMSPLQQDDARKGEVIAIESGLDASSFRTRVLEKIAETVEGVRLEDAGVVVSGGRGIGNAEGFEQLEELAKMLKGAIGASRPACDNGWVPDVIQVGLTGKVVSPELYIAVALSGSSQHMSGCSGAKNIVAINKDPEANIVKLSRFAVIGDWKKVLPAFTSKVKELLAG